VSTNGHQRRDVVVVGASAGGIFALPRLLGQLPGTFPASMMIAMHQGPRDNPHLVNILQRAATIPVQWAEQGERIESGRVYVAPPDTHMLIQEGYVRLSRGPRENFARPSIDRTMRSAAAQCGPRTIGVLLTGMMGDGVGGLLAIGQNGGRTIVQDPTDAEFSELPGRALATFEPDAVLKLEAIGPTLVELTTEPAPDVQPRDHLLLESQIDRVGPVSPRELDLLGQRQQQMCPDCGGPLWEVGEPQSRRWRCYLGHAYGARELLDKGDEQVEAALWSAVRALHERAATWDTLARDAKEAGNEIVAADYSLRAREAREQSEVARRFMLDLMRHAR
jgi:two-component system, chemotaxis family, protein-glutamate methylesterase/glutaminase